MCERVDHRLESMTPDRSIVPMPYARYSTHRKTLTPCMPRCRDAVVIAFSRATSALGWPTASALSPRQLLSGIIDNALRGFKMIISGG